jgi:hypothetical protein
MSAHEMRNYLASLHAERALALATETALATAELDELDAEIELARSAYAGVAVTEIATLRGELSGRPQG